MADEVELEGKIVIVKFTDCFNGVPVEWCLVIAVKNGVAYRLRGIDDLSPDSLGRGKECVCDTGAITFLKLLATDVYAPNKSFLDVKFKGPIYTENRDWYELSGFSHNDDFYLLLEAAGINVHFI